MSSGGYIQSDSHSDHLKNSSNSEESKTNSGIKSVPNNRLPVINQNPFKFDREIKIIKEEIEEEKKDSLLYLKRQMNRLDINEKKSETSPPVENLLLEKIKKTDQVLRQELLKQKTLLEDGNDISESESASDD